MLTTHDAKEMLRESVVHFCDDLSARISSPLMEADVVVSVYHYLKQGGCDPSQIYIDTRVCKHSPRSRKYDIVIGSLDKSNACINPTLIIQVKAFQRWGLTPQQHKRRFEGILDRDIPSLLEVQHQLPSGRIELISDLCKMPTYDRYLSGKWKGNKRIEVLRRKCAPSGIDLWWVRRNQEGDFDLEIIGS
jgi:hypothetical protein